MITINKPYFLSKIAQHQSCILHDLLFVLPLTMIAILCTKLVPFKLSCFQQELIPTGVKRSLSGHLPCDLLSPSNPILNNYTTRFCILLVCKGREGEGREDARVSPFYGKWGSKEWEGGEKLASALEGRQRNRGRQITLRGTGVPHRGLTPPWI